MTDDDDDTDRLRRLLFPRSEEEWTEAQAENEAAPREPGTYKVRVSAAPRPYVFDGECPRCHRHVHSEGIRFTDMSEDEDAELTLRMHWALACPAWKSRRHRWWYRHGWPRIKDRHRMRRLRRARAKERRDPNAWLQYWTKRN